MRITFSFIIFVSLFSTSFSQLERPYLTVPYTSFNTMEAYHFKNFFNFNQKTIVLQSVLSNRVINDSSAYLILLYSNNNSMSLPYDSTLQNFLQTFANHENPSDTGVIVICNIKYTRDKVSYRLIQAIINNYTDSTTFFLKYPVNSILDEIPNSFEISLQNTQKKLFFKPYFNQDIVSFNSWKDDDSTYIPKEIDTSLIDKYKNILGSSFSVGLVLSKDWIMQEANRGDFDFNYGSNRKVTIKSFDMSSKDSLVLFKGTFKESSASTLFHFEFNFLASNMLFKSVVIQPDLTGLSTQQIISAKFIAGTVKNLITQKANGKILKIIDKSELFSANLASQHFDFRLDEVFATFYEDHIFLILNILEK